MLPCAIGSPESTISWSDADDPDTPTVTFGAFDEAGRPHVLYEMIWGLPRRRADDLNA